MNEDMISRLQMENEELVKQAYYDGLTGILNRRATEEKIAEIMEKGGAYIIGDVNRFKQINDTYGHPEGDRYLKFVADTLKYKVREGDIVGRIGGDEFVMFLAGCRSLEGAEHLCARVDRAFQEFNDQQDNGIELGMAFGITLYQENDTYRSMYDRADQLMLENKKRVHLQPDLHMAENQVRDIDQIRSDLAEQLAVRGAFCQNYESFRSVYRFIERYLRRNDRKYCVILFSLKQEGSRILPHADRESMMNRLGELLRHSLRMSDVCTRYSCCQYLVLVSDAAEDMADEIARRIQKMFLQEQEHAERLVHCCYELQSVRIVE